MSSHDSHSAHTTPEYREGWDRIFVKCLRHRSSEGEDMSQRCTCEPTLRPEAQRPEIVCAKRSVP